MSLPRCDLTELPRVLCHQGTCHNGSGSGSASTLNRSLTHTVRSHRTEGSMKPTRIKGANDPLILQAITERPDWLQEKVLPRLDGYPNPDRCWSWTGAKNSRGYGVAHLPGSIRKVTVYIHRVTWLWTHGHIPAGHVIDHGGEGCRNILCANPSHVAAVTERINSAVTAIGGATERAMRTRCPKGHPLAEGNLVIAALARGQRNCLTCGRNRAREINDLKARAAIALGITQKDLQRAYGGSRSVLQRILAEAP